MQKVIYQLMSLLLVISMVSFTTGSALGAQIPELIPLSYVITPENLQEWSFNNETGSGINAFMVGPGAPPSGFGSVQLQIAGPEDGYTMYTWEWGGTLVSELSSLTYSTYHDITSLARDHQVPSLLLNIDYDVSNGYEWQGRLVFEPALTDGYTPEKGVWQTWDALNGMWWATEYPGNSICTRSEPCTLATITTAFPLVGLTGGVGFKVGDGWESGFIGNVDKFIIGDDLYVATYDFEPVLALTEIDLFQTIDPVAGPWDPVPGSLAEGYQILLDTDIEFYYFDADEVEVNYPLKDGYNEFFVTNYPVEFFDYWAGRGVIDGATGWQGVMWEIINGNTPIFYLKVVGSDVVLVDGLQYQLGQGDKPLRIEGSYLPGLYTFSGTVTDTLDRTDQVDVDILFNDLPLAYGQNLTTDEDNALPITLTADDVYPGTLQWIIVTAPEHGDISGIAPSITYTPDANYFGVDSFAFKVNDGDEDSNTATVGITVDAVNDKPIAISDSYTVNEDLILSVLAPGPLGNDTDADNDPLTAVKDTDPSHGSLTFNADGSFVYTPTANYAGADSFTYHVEDGEYSSDPVAISITVSPVNDAPVAVADSFLMNENTILEISAPGVLGNDTDLENDTMTAIFDIAPLHGELVLNANGSFTYTPDLDYSGVDTFSYHASDGDKNSNSVTVTITISDVTFWLFLPVIYN